MSYADKLLSYNPVFYWIGPYTSEQNVLSPDLTDHFPYTTGTLISWMKRSDWSPSGQETCILFGNTNLTTEIYAGKAGSNLASVGWLADGSGRSKSGAAAGTDWIPVFMQWDLAAQTIWGKINRAAKVSTTWAGMAAQETLATARLLPGFTGQLQYVALYDMLLSDIVLTDLEDMAMADVGHDFFTYLDYGGDKLGEASTVVIRHAAVTAANFTAQEGLHDALATALEAIMIDPALSKKSFGNIEEFNVTGSTSPLNQRESKWLVRYVDNDNGKGPYRLEVPGPDLTLLNPADPGKMLISSGAGAGFVTAFQNYQKSPDGNAVTVLEIIHVGRNT